MSNEQKTLQSTVEFLDDDCPQLLGLFATVDSLCYDSKDNLVKIGVILDEDVMSLTTMWSRYDELVVPTMIAYFSDYEPNLFSLMADADAQLKVYFNQQSTGDCTIVSVTPENLKEYYDKTLSKTEFAETNLKNLVLYEQSREWEAPEGITRENVYSTDASLVYVLKFDEEKYDYADNLTNKQKIYNYFMETYSDPVMMDYLQVVKDANRDIVFSHKFDTIRGQFDVIISRADIDRILNGQ